MRSTVIVLRHALAGDRAAWPADDPSRPLDLAGLAQSYELVAAFAGHRIDRIWTSPYTRCQQTVVPVASIRRLPVVDRPWLAEHVTDGDISRGLAEVPDHTVLCTHGANSQVIGEILAPGHGLGELDKGAAWVIARDAKGPVAVGHIVAPSGRVAPFAAAS